MPMINSIAHDLSNKTINVANVLFFYLKWLKKKKGWEDASKET